MYTNVPLSFTRSLFLYVYIFSQILGLTWTHLDSLGLT